MPLCPLRAPRLKIFNYYNNADEAKTKNDNTLKDTVFWKNYNPLNLKFWA